MAIHEILVERRDEVGDPRGAELSAEIQRTLGITTGVRTANVFRVEGIDDSQAVLLAQEALVDPITESFVLNPVAEEGGEVLEVAYRREVTDPVSGTINKVAKALDAPLDGVQVATRYIFDNTTPEQAEHVAERLLVNEAVQQLIKIKPESLKIIGERKQIETFDLRDLSLSELREISKERKLQLDDSEMLAIQDEFKRLERPARDGELEVMGGRWSEHCVHKTFNADILINGEVKPSLFTMTKEAARRNFGELVATAFEDNSGGMFFYDGTVILVKWETHNSPSANDPYSGAATGSGGVFRDIMGTGQGARVILSCDAFAVAPIDMDEDELPPETIPPDSMLRGLVAGVRDYGNPMGIPTPNGSVHFHPDFAAKPTVLVGAYGITPEKYAQQGQPQLNDRVIVIGGRTGRDGIHGATVSSAERTAESTKRNKDHVQLGNPIEEKKFADAILEARDRGLIRALTDCGAAGFSSAIGELAENIGVNVDISKAPLKYEGLAAWEIWLSESQERMALAIDPEKIEEFIEVCALYNVEATDLGSFDGSNKLTVKYGEETVVDLDYRFLKEGRPNKVMEAEFVREVFEEPEIDEPTDWNEALKKVLMHGNVCSKEPIVEQYDTTVQGTNVLAPFSGVKFDAPNDATIITPILGKPYGMIVSHGLNPILNRIDPSRGAKWAAVEAVSNLVAVGGNFRETVLCGNYISPTPDKQYMGSLYQQVSAVCDFQDAMGMPIVSGKDSLSSTYTWPDGKKTHVPPVVNISTMGRIPDVSKTVSTDFKRKGSTLVMVGKQHKGMGGSTYYDTHGIVGNEVPDVDLELLPEVFDSIHNGIVSGDIAACHDISEGGLITAVTEMAFGGDCGVDLDIDIEGRADFFLFNETAGTFVIEVESIEKAQELFGEVPYMVIGTTKKEKEISVRHQERALFTANVDELKEAWKAPMRKLFH